VQFRLLSVASYFPGDAQQVFLHGPVGCVWCSQRELPISLSARTVSPQEINDAFANTTGRDCFDPLLHDRADRRLWQEGPGAAAAAPAGSAGRAAAAATSAAASSASAAAAVRRTREVRGADSAGLRTRTQAEANSVKGEEGRNSLFFLFWAVVPRPVQ